MQNTFHFYRYVNNWAMGVGFERTFVGWNAFRIGLGWWCLSITWPRQRPHPWRGNESVG